MKKKFAVAGVAENDKEIVVAAYVVLAESYEEAEDKCDALLRRDLPPWKGYDGYQVDAVSIDEVEDV